MRKDQQKLEKTTTQEESSYALAMTNSLSIELVTIKDTVFIIRITFTRALRRNGFEADKYMTPVIWENLMSKVRSICEQHLDKPGSNPGKPAVSRTQDLQLEHFFEATAHLYKPIMGLQFQMPGKENQRASQLMISDDVLNVTASLKRDKRGSSKEPALKVHGNIWINSPDKTLPKHSGPLPSPLLGLQRLGGLETKTLKAPKPATSAEPAATKSGEEKMAPTTRSSVQEKNKKNSASKPKKETLKRQTQISQFFNVVEKKEEKVVIKKDKIEVLTQEIPHKRRLFDENAKVEDEKISKPRKPRTCKAPSEVAVKKETKPRKAEKKKSENDAGPSDPPKHPRIRCEEEDELIKGEGGDETWSHITDTARMLRTPVKTSTRMEHDPRMDEHMSEFPDPVDDPHFISDCKVLRTSFETCDVHLVTPPIVKRMVRNNLSYLKAIHSGHVFSLLCQEYNQGHEQQFKMEYGDAHCLFSETNLGLFSRFIGKHFAADDTEHLNNLNYYLKVLMPELITKLVMACYKISKREATLKKKELGIKFTNTLAHEFGL